MKKILSVFKLVFCLTLFLNIEGNCQADDFPPNSQYSKVSIPDLERPDYLESIKDPVFGTQIIRITDSLAFGKKNVRHHYSKDQPWNCDQTLILMEKWILDGTNYKIIRKMDIPNEPRWSHRNPKIIFGVKGNSFVSFNALTGESQTLHTFSEYNKILIGPWEGNLSADDRYVAFQGDISGEWHVLVFDILNNKLLSSKRAKDLGPFQSFDWVSISPSGEYVVINWRQRNSKAGGIITYDRNLNKVAELFPRGEHGDLGYDADGNEVFVQVCPFRFARLDNGEQTSFFTNACGHMSLRNYKRPGWCYASIGTENTDVLAIKLDKSGVVERFTHHRSKRTNYNAEAHAVASPDGKKVMFVSNWLGTSEINSYVVSISDEESSTINRVNVAASPIDEQLSTPNSIGPQEVLQTALGTGKRNLFVSPTGSGSGCSETNPCNLKTGIRQSQAGDIVFLRGGQYDLLVKGMLFNQSGTQCHPVVYESYPGELAIFDGSKHAKAAKVRISLTGSWIELRRVEVRYMPQTGLRITGNHNLMDGIHSHHNSGTGIHIFSDYNAYPYGAEGSYNTIKNSTVHNNSDAGLTYADDNWGNDGGDADGISISSGDGNSAFNNLVYYNSDDGVDSWRSTNTEFAYNIIHSNGIANGNGNGIKAGGVNQSFNTYVHHNISYNNRATGIDFNSGIDVLFYNNVSYNNNTGYTLGKTTTTVNNIEFGNNAPSYRSGNHHHNSWNLSDYTVSEIDFISLDPNSPDFLRLKADSGLENGGYDVGFPFKGTAPDLGVYEQY